MAEEMEYVHPYERVAAKIAARIAAGDPPPGRRLPAVRALAVQHGTTNAAVQRALSLLVEQGWVSRIPNVGAFARVPGGPEPRPTTADVLQAVESLEEAVAELGRRVARLEGEDGVRDVRPLGAVDRPR